MTTPARITGCLLGAALAMLAAAMPVRAQPAQANPAIDSFFADYTKEWLRLDPGLATRTRDLSGAEQDLLERQLTPETTAWKHQRIALAKSGLERLRAFDPAQMSESQRVSAELMQWQLQAAVDEEPFLDDSFPLEQFGGANVNLVNALVITHPLLTPRDAENFVAEAYARLILARLDGALKNAQEL